MSNEHNRLKGETDEQYANRMSNLCDSAFRSGVWRVFTVVFWIVCGTSALGAATEGRFGWTYYLLCVYLLIHAIGTLAEKISERQP